MCDPLESQSHLDDYFSLVKGVEVVNEWREKDLRVRLLESPSTGNITPTLRWRFDGEETPSVSLPTIEASAIRKRPICPIRVIFTGIDEPNKSNIQGLRDLFEAYTVPSVFLKERVSGVTNSFGQRDTNHNTLDSWFHFLCKNIVLVYDSEGKNPRLCGPTPREHLAAGGPSWIQGGFFMKWNKAGGNIFLICFGVFPSIEERLRRFVENTDNVQTALYDPYVLQVIIFDELNSKMDSIVWDLITVFNHTEEQMFAFAAAQAKRQIIGYDVDFEHLHNLEKHVIHLKEAIEAVINTVKCVQRAHSDLFKASHFSQVTPHPAIPATEKNLEYLLNSFHALSLRIKSVEIRVKNVINLGFNLVIQRDSTLLQKDSASMSTVALMTLVFLPGTAVASMFGTQFFNTDFSEGGARKLNVSSDFWLFWAVSLSVTTITLLVWYFWYRKDTSRRYSGDRKKVEIKKRASDSIA